MIDLKRNEKDMVFGGKGLLEHTCSITKEVVKNAGLAYCIALPDDADMFRRIGQLNEAKKRGLCSAVIVGATEMSYHLAEWVFGFDTQKSEKKEQ